MLMLVLLPDGEPWFDLPGSDLACGERVLCVLSWWFRGEWEVAGRSRRCLRSLSCELLVRGVDPTRGISYLSGLIP